MSEFAILIIQNIECWPWLWPFPIWVFYVSKRVIYYITSKIVIACHLKVAFHSRYMNKLLNLQKHHINCILNINNFITFTMRCNLCKKRFRLACERQTLNSTKNRIKHTWIWLFLPLLRHIKLNILVVNY